MIADAEAVSPGLWWTRRAREACVASIVFVVGIAADSGAADAMAASLWLVLAIPYSATLWLLRHPGQLWGRLVGGLTSVAAVLPLALIAVNGILVVGFAWRPIFFGCAALMLPAQMLLLAGSILGTSDDGRPRVRR